MKRAQRIPPLITIIIACLGFLVVTGLITSYPQLHQRWLDTCLWSAAMQNHSEAVSELMRQGANINGRDKDDNPLLNEVLGWGYIETAHVLLHSNPDVNAINPRARSTSLMMASSFGAYDIVVELINRGANVNAQSVSGNTALLVAATNRNSKIVTYLLKHGADRNLRDMYGNTALIKAQKRLNDTNDFKRRLEYEAVVKLLQQPDRGI